MTINFFTHPNYSQLNYPNKGYVYQKPCSYNKTFIHVTQEVQEVSEKY